MSQEVSNTGKHDFHRFIFFFIFFFMKKRNSKTVAVLDIEILHVNKFSSDLVHRHIIFPLTLFLLEKLMIISPDKTL